MEKEKQRPVHEVTIPFNGSLIKSAIWCRQEADKHPRFSVSLSRGYRPKGGGKWVFSGFFQRDETIGLVMVLHETHRWIMAHEATDAPKELAEAPKEADESPMDATEAQTETKEDPTHE